MVAAVSLLEDQADHDAGGNGEAGLTALPHGDPMILLTLGGQAAATL